MSSKVLINVYLCVVGINVLIRNINGDHDHHELLSDFAEYDNGYFIGVDYHGNDTNSVTWQDAELYCHIFHGTNLASIHSELENNQAFEAAYAAGARPDGANNLIWIGFHDIDYEGTFIWSDGSIIDYANWDNGEPNDFNNGNPGEDCTSVRGSTKWNDLPCDATLVGHTVTSFVCNRRKSFNCAKQCNELTRYQDGCANNECLKDCANCVLDIAWDDYENGQNVSCQCHDNGCDECRNGYFKVDYDFPCQSCDDIDGCLHCTDFYGCQQCKEGYELVEDNHCGEDSVHNTGSVKVHYCKAIRDRHDETPHPSPNPTPEARVVCPNYNDYNYGECRYDHYCSNCQSWGCADCNDDYYKMGNFKRCQSCSTNYPNCRKCDDWNGCVECNSGYELRWSSQCGDEVCIPL